MIKKPTEKTMIKAVELLTSNLHFIENPSDFIQDLVLNQGLENFRYINNPSKKSQKIIIDYLKEKGSLYYNFSPYSPTYYLLDHDKTYDPSFLRICHYLLNKQHHKALIESHKNYIRSDAKFILDQITGESNE